MKNITLLLLLFAATAAYGQTQPPTQQFNGILFKYGNSLRIDSNLFIPKRDTMPFNAALTAMGNLRFRPVDSTLYIYRGNKWGRMAFYDDINSNRGYKITASVSSLSSLGAPDSLVFVSDTLRGGYFIWSNAGVVDGGTVFAASTGFWKRQYPETEGVSIAWFGPISDGLNDDSSAFNRAIRVGTKKVFIPKGNYAISKVNLRSELEIFGEPGTKINQLNVSPNQSGTFEYRRTDGSTGGNIFIHDIKFECYPHSANNLNNAILFLVDTLSLVENVRIERCDFFRQVQTAILFLNRFQDYLGIRNVSIDGCNAVGDTSIPTHSRNFNLVRFFGNHQIFLPGNYGKIFYENVSITNCKGEYIRTIADVKRGGRNILVANNTSVNCYDVSYSTDGCRSVVIDGNTIDVDDYFLPQIIAGGAQIEVQGENVIVSNNQIRYAKNNGILISDYGYPDEAGVGHNSRNVTVTGNSIGNAQAIAIKLVNVIGGLVTGNYIDFAKTRSVSIDSGTGLDDTLGNPLKGKFVNVLGNKISDTSNIFIATDSSVVANNFSTRLPATINNSSANTWIAPATASEYLTLIKTVDGSGSGLDADLLDGRESNTFYSNSLTNFTDFNSATGNSFYGLSAFQPTNRPPSGNFFSVLNIDQSVANNNRFQMSWQNATQNIYIRNQLLGTWGGWNRLYHTGDFTASVPAAANTVLQRDAFGGIFATSIKTAIRTITATSTLDISDRYVNANGGVDITVNLPAASTCAGIEYVVKKISNNAFTVIIDPNGSENINGSSTPLVISTYLASITFASDGTAWWVY